MIRIQLNNLQKILKMTLGDLMHKIGIIKVLQIINAMDYALENQEIKSVKME